MAKVVDQARRNSDRRLLVAGGRLDAENELEQALLERTVRDNIRLSRPQAQPASASSITSVPNMTWCCHTSVLCSDVILFVSV